MFESILVLKKERESLKLYKIFLFIPLINNNNTGKNKKSKINIIQALVLI